MSLIGINPNRRVPVADPTLTFAADVPQDEPANPALDPYAAIMAALLANAIGIRRRIRMGA